jgi:hypothetical protein
MPGLRERLVLGRRIIGDCAAKTVHHLAGARDPAVPFGLGGVERPLAGGHHRFVALVPGGGAASRGKVLVCRPGSRRGCPLGIGRPVRRQAVLAFPLALARSRTEPFAGDQRDDLIEPAGIARRGLVHAVRFEPGEMGEQQAVVIAAPRPDLLAAVEDRLLHAVERAAAEHLPRVVAGQYQRRVPAAREHHVAPPLDIGGLGGDAHGRAGRSDVAVESQVLDEGRLAHRVPAVAAVGWRKVGRRDVGGLIHGPVAPCENKP